MTVGLLSFVKQTSSPFWTPGQRPFAASSPINQALAANSILVPLNWQAPGPAQSFYNTNPKVYFDQPAGGAPTVAVTNTLPGWGNAPATINRVMTIGMDHTGSDTDMEAVSIIGNDCRSYWVFTRESDTTAICLEWAGCDIVLDSGFGPSSVTGGSVASGVYASGQSCMAGPLIKEEFTAGAINHAVAICLNSIYQNAGAPYFPAVNNDGNSTNGFSVEGLFFGIDPALSMPAALASLPFSQKVFRALQVYGGINCDVGGVTQFYAALSWNNPSTSWVGADLTNDLIPGAAVILPLMQKVGPALDGLYQAMAPFDTYAPQRLILAHTGALMNVTRDSGGSQDIGQTAAPQSLLDTSAITSFGSGTTVRCATYYGQFGLHDFTSVGSTAPVIFASSALKATANGTPALFFDGTGANIMQAVGSSASYPNGNMHLMAQGVQLADYAANYTLISGDAAGCLELRVDQTTGLVRLLKQGGATIGVTTYPIPLNEPVVPEAIYRTDGSYEIRLNGIIIVQGTGTLVTVNAANVRVGAGPSGANPLKGLITGWHIGSNVSANFSNPQFSFNAYLKNFLGPLGTIAVNSTVLDPTFTFATLSNGNLTAFGSVSGALTARSTTSHSSGLLYFEATINVQTGSTSAVGICNSSLIHNSFNYPGVNTFGIGYLPSGVVQINSATVATLASFTAGAIIGIAVDLTHSKIWFGIISGSTVLWNNDVLANQNPATNTGGISISTLAAGPYFAAVAPSEFGDTMTVNFGGTAYTDQTLVPAGSGNW